MQLVPVEQKADMTLPYVQKAGLVPPPGADAPGSRAKVLDIVRAAGDRIKTAGDILDYTDFFVPDNQLPYDAPAFEKRIRKPPEAAGLLRKFREQLASAEPFDAVDLEKLMQEFVQSEGVSIGQMIHPLRVAVTGKTVGFGLFETLAILGKGRCLARIDGALARV